MGHSDFLWPHLIVSFSTLVVIHDIEFHFLKNFLQDFIYVFMREREAKGEEAGSPWIREPDPRTPGL